MAVMGLNATLTITIRGCGSARNIEISVRKMRKRNSSGTISASHSKKMARQTNRSTKNSAASTRTSSPRQKRRSRMNRKRSQTKRKRQRKARTPSRVSRQRLSPSNDKRLKKRRLARNSSDNLRKS